ncbi:hypothetical protein D8S78_24495 [Natrialba swarupiae]|nr:hypothetical protein [Natrialba swarupiae]
MGRSKRHADIVGATTNRAANFRKNEFDLCVIDEATQADIPSTLIPFYRSEQLILAGDHKQLPPHCSDEDMRRENMHRPLFERLLDLYDENISVTLRRQYRMNGTIAGSRIRHSTTASWKMLTKTRVGQSTECRRWSESISAVKKTIMEQARKPRRGPGRCWTGEAPVKQRCRC